MVKRVIRRNQRFKPTADRTLDFRSEKLRALYRYWDSKRAGRLMSERRDIEPTEIPSLLPHIALIGVEAAPRRLYYRLIGTHLTEALGRDNTGKYFEEAFQGQVLEDITHVYDAVITSCAPIRYFGQALYSKNEYREYESVHLPLSQDGKTVSIVLVGQEYFLDD
jgi:hypothetical protein